MKRIAKFHKVSPEQFAKDWKDTFPAADDKEIQDTYEKISLPVRATAGSAGYTHHPHNHRAGKFSSL